MRRVIKPFAVEVRSAGRKKRVSEPKAPMWPELADQPAVEWPEALLPSTANAEPVEMAEQVAAPQAAEPYRDPRTPPPVVKAMPHAADAEAPPARLTGRVLPVIEDPKPVAEQTVKPNPSVVRAKRAKVVRVAEPIAAEAESVPEMSAGSTLAAEVPLKRRGTDRLARADFKRGERWKARLPAVVHRDPKRRRKLRPHSTR